MSVMTSYTFHTDQSVIAKVGLEKSTLLLKSGRWTDLAIFLPDGVNAQPIVDAFNAAMEAANPKQESA